MTTRIFWFLLGVIIAALWFYRNTIRDFIKNKPKLNAAQKVVGGVQEAAGGIKDLWESFQ
jgi:hypothetical protein